MLSAASDSNTDGSVRDGVRPHIASEYLSSMTTVLFALPRMYIMTTKYGFLGITLCDTQNLVLRAYFEWCVRSWIMRRHITTDALNMNIHHLSTYPLRLLTTSRKHLGSFNVRRGKSTESEPRLYTIDGQT